MYYIIYGLVYLLSILPFWVLYGLADFLFIIIYYVARYRRKIVRKNLCNSFPEKSEKEIKSIERKFYRWFCDYLFETFKLLSISDKNLLKHIDFVGLEGWEDAFDRGQDCATILGHYCNWEWLSATGSHNRTDLSPTQKQGHGPTFPQTEECAQRILREKGLHPPHCCPAEEREQAEYVRVYQRPNPKMGQYPPVA